MIYAFRTEDFVTVMVEADDEEDAMAMLVDNKVVPHAEGLVLSTSGHMVKVVGIFTVSGKVDMEEGFKP